MGEYSFWQQVAPLFARRRPLCGRSDRRTMVAAARHDARRRGIDCLVGIVDLAGAIRPPNWASNWSARPGAGSRADRLREMFSFVPLWRCCCRRGPQLGAIRIAAKSKHRPGRRKARCSFGWPTCPATRSHLFPASRPAHFRRPLGALKVAPLEQLRVASLETMASCESGELRGGNRDL